MNLKTIKQFLVFLLIDFLFVFCAFTFIKFMLNKVKDYFLNLQTLNLDFESMGESLLQNASNLNLDLLGNNLDIINTVAQKVMFYSLYTLIGIFLLYCISQAVQWNLVFNKLKFKHFGRYLLKFILINIPIFLVLIYIFYGIMYNLRGLVFNSWIENTYLESQFSYSGSFPILFVLIILFLAVIYFTINLYILMNKYKFKEALVNSFNNFKNYKLILRYLVYIVILFLVMFTSGINLILCLVLCLSLIEIFRMDFSRLLK